jgi:RimJ/RimL family protein N-acetyltransferase
MITYDEVPGVGLIPLEKRRIEVYRTWRNRPEIRKWCRQYDLISERDQELWFEWQNDDPNTHMFEVMEVPDKIYDGIGVCGLTSCDLINRRAEFSLYIAPTYQGEGLGSKALKALLLFGFNSLNLNLIWGECFDGNPALKMFEKLGFQSDGIRRDFYFRDGQYIDAHLVSIKKLELELRL